MNKIALSSMVWLLSCHAHADIYVIGKSSLPISTIPIETVREIYLGSTTALGSSLYLEPLTQEDKNEITESFNTKIVKKSTMQMSAYWARIVFTGKGTPPKTLYDNEEVIAAVVTGNNTIGYVDTNELPADVKILLTVQ